MAVTILSNATLLNYEMSSFRKIVVDGVTVTASSVTRNGDFITISGLRITGNARNLVQFGTTNIALYFGIPTGAGGVPADQLSPMVVFTTQLVLPTSNQWEVAFDYSAPSDFVFPADRYATTADVGVLAGIVLPSYYFPSATTATVTFPRNHPFYGSVNGKSKLVRKLYYPVNGKSKEIKKLYGSVNGKSKLIYRAADFGRVYYEVGTSGEIRSVELRSLAEFNSLAGTATSMSIGGGTVTVTRVRGAGNNSIVGLDIGGMVTTIPDRFLQGCTNFTRALTVPSNITTIGGNFMLGCTAFNSALALPDTITTIGSSFMSGCTAFNQSLHTSSGAMPADLTAVGMQFLDGCTSFNKPIYFGDKLQRIDSVFMRNCTSFNQILRVGTPTSSAITAVGSHFMYNCKAMTNQAQLYFTPSYMTQSEYSFATDDSSAACYTTGTQIVAKTATDRNTFLSRFPNSTSSPYRKLR